MRSGGFTLEYRLFGFGKKRVLIKSVIDIRTKNPGFLTRIYLFSKCSKVLYLQGFSGFFDFPESQFEIIKKRFRCTPVAHILPSLLASLKYFRTFDECRLLCYNVGKGGEML